jgi:hypothetical protein
MLMTSRLVTPDVPHSLAAGHSTAPHLGGPLLQSRQRRWSRAPPRSARL